MIKEILNNGIEPFNAWLKTHDLSVLFIKHCYAQAGKKLNIDCYTVQELYDSVKAISKKVYKSKLKEGDIVFIGDNDNYNKTGLFIKEGEGGINFHCLEIKVFSTGVVMSEVIRLHSNASFFRPNSEVEEEEVKPKKKHDK